MNIFLYAIVLFYCNSLISAAQENRIESRFGGAKKGLSVVYEVNLLDWEYPSEADRQRAINNGDFIAANSVPIDTDVYYSPFAKNDSIFVTVPRFNLGVPASLNTINSDGKLKPYPPDWSWHNQSKYCGTDRIVSVFRTAIDECNRLWTVDTGVIHGEQICPPQILAFDLKTNKIIWKYTIPNDQYYSGETLFITPVVDVRDPQFGCKDTFIYVADVTRFGLLVYDVNRDKSWRITSNLFYPYPPQGFFTIAGESFDLMDGLFGLALSPYRLGDDRTLFFHALASITENRVATSIIRNQTLFQNNENSAPREFYLYPYTRPSQATAIAIDRNGIEYFVLTNELALACWNTCTDYSTKNFEYLEKNPVTLQFASGVKVIRNGQGDEELWVITNRFQKIANGDLNPNEINFRIQAANISNLVYGTKCANNISNRGRPMSGGYGFVKPPRRRY